MRRAEFNQAELRAAEWLGLAAFCARTSAWLLALNSRRTRRFVLPILILLALPIVHSGWSVRAGFVVDVGDSVAVVASEQSSEQAVIVAESSCHSGASFSDSLRRTPPASSSTQNIRSPFEFPVHSQSQVPFDGGRPSPFAPPQKAPVDFNTGHGMGGSQTNQGVGAGVIAVSLPSVPVMIGPELAMRLFAREAGLHIEKIAGRLFRPPRA